MQDGGICAWGTVLGLRDIMIPKPVMSCPLGA